MIEVISSAWHRARKRHLCGSCLGAIEPGETYYSQKQRDGGELQTYREHEACYRASEIVAAHLDWMDTADGMPRVCEMEREDRETVAAEAPEVAAVLWPDLVHEPSGQKYAPGQGRGHTTDTDLAGGARAALAGEE